MSEEFEGRIRAARTALGSPRPEVARRVLSAITLPSPGASPRRRSRVRHLIGAVAGVGTLMAVLGVLLVSTSSSDPATTPPVADGPPVVVPDVNGIEIEDAYARLRAVGLRVSTSEWQWLRPSGSLHIVDGQQPAPRQTVPGGTTVTLRRAPAGPVPSLVVPSRGTQFEVPDFVGRPMEEAVIWARARGLQWAAGILPPLESADAPTFLANFTVARQNVPKGGTIWRGPGPGRGIESISTLVLNPVISADVPRINLASIPPTPVLFSVHSQGPLFAAPKGTLVTSGGLLGRVGILQLADAKCSTCPTDPFSRLPVTEGVGLTDLGMALVVPNEMTRRPTWWETNPGGQFDVLELSSDPGAFGPGVPGVALIDRQARLAALLPEPVDTGVLQSLVNALTAEPVPPIATNPTALPLAALRGPGIDAKKSASTVALLGVGLETVGCSVDLEQVHLLGSSTDERFGVYVVRIHGDRIAVLATRGSNGNQGASGGGCVPADRVRRGFEESPLLPVETVEVPGQDGAPVIRYAGWVVADNTFTEAVVDGTTFPVKNNVVIVEGFYPSGTVVRFSGPTASAEVVLRTSSATPPVAGPPSSP